MIRRAAVLGVVVVACAARAVAADPPSPDPAAAQAQLLSMCEALKPRGGSCGARAKAADSPPMSSAAPAVAAADAPGAAPVKPVDAWGNPVRISIDNGTLKLESPGADGALNSADDVVQRCPAN
jgi:hypothetical protein